MGWIGGGGKTSAKETKIARSVKRRVEKEKSENHFESRGRRYDQRGAGDATQGRSLTKIWTLKLGGGGTGKETPQLRVTQAGTSGANHRRNRAGLVTRNRRGRRGQARKKRVSHWRGGGAD